MTSQNAELPLEVDVQQVKVLLDEGMEFLFLDCRQPEEHATAAIDGTTLIPMGELQDRISELEEYRDARIIVHCHHGGRSLRVTHWLRGQGFAKVQNMAGGIDAWSEQIDPNVPRY